MRWIFSCVRVCSASLHPHEAKPGLRGDRGCARAFGREEQNHALLFPAFSARSGRLPKPPLMPLICAGLEEDFTAEARRRGRKKQELTTDLREFRRIIFGSTRQYR